MLREREREQADRQTEKREDVGQDRKHLLVLCPCSNMGLWLAAVESGVSHASNVGVHVNLGPHAELLAHFTPLLHLLPNRQVLFNT